MSLRRELPGDEPSQAVEWHAGRLEPSSPGLLSRPLALAERVTAAQEMLQAGHGSGPEPLGSQYFWPCELT